MKSSRSILGGGAIPARPRADNAWFDQLYRSNFPAVFRRCAGILKNQDDAADASHEVFLTALDSLRPNSADGQARAWLLTVARNHCLDLLRRRKRLGQALVTLGHDSDGEIDVESAIADRDFVDGVISRLPARERQALWESAVEHRPLADIAGHLRLSYMAAAQVVHRARLHALEMAIKVAIVLGVFRLGRSVKRLGMLSARFVGKADQSAGEAPILALQRVLAAAAVPLIVAASQSSSSPAAGSLAPAVITITARQSQTQPSAVENLKAAASGAGISTETTSPAGRILREPPGPSATSMANSLVNQLKASAGVPSVTLPTVQPLPSVLPSALPSVLPSPSVP